MARCAFSFWPWAAARRADRTRRNIVNQLRVDNIGQRFFMTVRTGGKWKTGRGIRVNTAGRVMLHHVCIHEIFTTTGDIYESLDEIPSSSPPKKNPPSDKRSSIIATLTLFFFFLLTRVVFYFISLGIRNWRNKDLLSNLLITRKLDLEFVLNFDFGYYSFFFSHGSKVYKWQNYVRKERKRICSYNF